VPGCYSKICNGNTFKKKHNTMADVSLDEETLTPSTEPTWIPKDLEKVELDTTEFVEEAIHTEDNKGTT
jgi:hypothetical protein